MNSHVSCSCDASRTARRNGDVSGNSVLNARLGMGRSNTIAGRKVSTIDHYNGMAYMGFLSI
jgi:hypothetical protein